MKNNLKELRIKRGVSQTTLAEAIGTTKRTIYSIEVENKDIHISLARKLATYLGCGIDDLFVSEDNAHTTADKALWFAHVVRYTAEELGTSIRDTIKNLERSGLAQRVVAGYDVWHTQGYEYMAEMLSEELSKTQGE
jgi:putative transcriptional regulator